MRGCAFEPHPHRFLYLAVFSVFRKWASYLAVFSMSQVRSPQRHFIAPIEFVTFFFSKYVFDSVLLMPSIRLPWVNSIQRARRNFLFFKKVWLMWQSYRGSIAAEALHIAPIEFVTLVTEFFFFKVCFWQCIIDAEHKFTMGKLNSTCQEKLFVFKKKCD